MDRTTIKWIAIICMALNHTAHVLLTPGTVLYNIFIVTGYFTAITMCFFLAEGYKYTRGRKKYAARLLLCAVISQAPYSFALQIGNLNMMFSLFLSFVLLMIIDSKSLPYLIRAILVVPVLILSLFTDWALSAPVFTLFFYRIGKKGYISSCIFYILWRTINTGDPFTALIFLIPMILSGLIVNYLYNGQRGRDMKWFFYLFYPAHLLILVLVARFI